jgi:hypothetical protein
LYWFKCDLFHYMLSKSAMYSPIGACSPSRTFHVLSLLKNKVTLISINKFGSNINFDKSSLWNNVITITLTRDYIK